MELSSKIIDALLSADSKALATAGPQGLNVVPVSTIRIVDGKVLLINYFFKKTLNNLRAQPQASLVAWKGFDGYQVRAKVAYVESGPDFTEAQAWVAGMLPGRIVKGLLILTPTEVFDISPAAAG